MEGWCCVCLAQARVYGEERIITEKMHPLDWPVGKPIFLIDG